MDNNVFTCKGCGHELPNDFSIRTESYCYMCDPNVTVDELLQDHEDKVASITASRERLGTDKLELKYLAPFLPYGLKIFTYDDDMYAVIQGIKNIHFHGKNGNSSIETSEGWDLEYHEFKPILHPLSDLTKPIPDGQTLMLSESLGREFEMNVVEFNLLIQNLNNSKFILRTSSFLVIQRLIAYHFDVFSLIPAGLAISYREAGL